jgi:hypothetical protein
MSSNHLPISPKHKTFAFFFVLCSYWLSSSPAWAIGADSLTVQVFTVSGTKVKYQYGTLFLKEGFIPLSTQYYDLGIALALVSSDDLAAINGKPVYSLSDWIQENNVGGGNYLANFPRSQATYTINRGPFVIVSVKGQPVPVTKDTKPTLNSISPEWDAEAGQPFTIPLSVVDAEQDDFVITGGPKGSTFSQSYDLNQLPTVDFQWTPTDAQANKIYTVKFKAKETAAKKLSSNIVTAKIRVWPAGGQTDAASVSKFSVSTTKWKPDVLTLSGKVKLNKIMSPAQRMAFLAKELDLTITSGNTGTGLPVGSSPLLLKLANNGNWTVTMPLSEAEVPCQITLKYQDRPATRTVSRAPKNCLK